MNRVNHIYCGLILSFFSAEYNLASNKKKDNQNSIKPNVIIIITDDQGYGELSAHGNPVLKTPNLDLLREESIRFENFHTAPMSTPTRGQLLTGIDACKNGAVNVSSGRAILNPKYPTMSEILLNNGYKTAIFGKWHLGDNYPFRPEDRGFQKTLWFPSSHIGSIPDYWNNDYNDDVYIEDGEKKRFSGYCTDVFFENAMKWINEIKSNDNPFFTYIATNAPHEPYNALASDILTIEKDINKIKFSESANSKKENIIKYLAMISNIDTNIGKLIKFLNDEDLAKNTILIFLTDNGGTFGPDYFNAGMRGRKTELYEGGHRVPFFIRYPNGSGFEIPRGIYGLTQTQDVLPTILDLCEIERRKYRFDGISLSSVLQNNKTVPDRTLFVNYSRMPYFFDYPSPYSNSILKKSDTGVLWREWRYLNQKELYNLTNDPLQIKNVIADYPDIVNKLNSDLDKWWEKIEKVDNIPLSIPVGYNDDTIKLTACEWLDVFMDQQSQVLKGEEKNSYWLLDVREDGFYEFELRRFPIESGLKFNQINNSKYSFDVNKARLFIGSINNSISMLNPTRIDEFSAVFKVKLSKGNIALHTWLDDVNGNPIAGAYYVYVSKLPKRNL